MEVTSSTAQASSAEIKETEIRNLVAVKFLTRKIKLISQAKKPDSLRSPTKTIMPTKNRITSKEANLIKCSMSTVLVTNKTAIPKKAMAKRKSQNKSVARTDAEKIDTEII